MGLEVNPTKLDLYIKPVEQKATACRDRSNNSVFESSLDNLKEHKTELTVAGGLLTAGLIGLSLFSRKNCLKISKSDLKSAVKSENFIGQGAEGSVYKIPNSNYVLKVPHSIEKLGSNLRLKTRVRERDRINHVVAHYGKCPIMEYIPGVPASEASAELIDSLTVSNIKDFYLDAAHANKHRMWMDPNGDNFLINPLTGKINIIDYVYSHNRTNFQMLDTLRTMFSYYAREGFNSMTATQQNSLLQKEVIGLLELVRDKKINRKYLVDYDKYFSLMPRNCKDTGYFYKTDEILKKYKYSHISLDECIKRIKNLSPEVEKDIVLSKI